MNDGECCCWVMCVGCGLVVVMCEVDGDARDGDVSFFSSRRGGARR